MSTIKQNHADPWQVTASSSPSVTASVSADSALQIFLTDIHISTDNSTALASTFTVSTSSSALKTTLWQGNFDIKGYFDHAFVQPIQCKPGEALVITATTTPTTAKVYVNASGFKVHLT